MDSPGWKRFLDPGANLVMKRGTGRRDDGSSVRQDCHSYGRGQCAGDAMLRFRYVFAALPVSCVRSKPHRENREHNSDHDRIREKRAACDPAGQLSSPHRVHKSRCDQSSGPQNYRGDTASCVPLESPFCYGQRSVRG
jgi:hypothetical protein